MRTSRGILIRSSLSAALLAMLPAAASACSACMGNPNSKTAGAINGAIFLMLGFVALMLGAIAAFALNLRKRAQAPAPPHVEISQMTPPFDDNH